MMLHSKLKIVKSFLKEIVDGNKPSVLSCDELQMAMQEMKLTSKVTSFRMAKQYSINRPLVTSEIIRIPRHIRGYAIAGAIDQTVNYSYLNQLRKNGVIDHSGMIQAVEGWISEDGPFLISDFYKQEDFTLDKWALGLIELAKWGDVPRAAAQIAIHNQDHYEWAKYLIDKTEFGDPSNAIVDLYEKKLIHNHNYVVEFVTKDWVGCPASAAKRLYLLGQIKIELFRVLVKTARSGDPAKVVLDSFLIQDVDFAKEIVKRDVGISCPKLAFRLVEMGVDKKWAYDTIEKSKYKSYLGNFN